MTPDGARPRVSVVTPTYRRPQMLAEALGSALGQSLTDLEVLVCDNADDPETREVVESFDDPRVTYLGRPENLGMIANALDGFRRCTGELVVKLDDDDALEPDALERLVARFEGRPEVTVAFGDVTLVDAQGRPMPAQTDQLRRDTGREGLRPGYHAPFSELAACGAVSLAGAVLRRSAIDWDAVPEWAGTSYDLYLTLQAARGGATACYDDRPVVRYRIHGSNDSVKNVVPSLEAAQRILRDASASGEHSLGAAWTEQLVTAHRRLSREYLLQGDPAAARRHAVRSLRTAPTPGGAVALAMSALPGDLGGRIARHRRQSYLDHAAQG